MRTAAAVLSIAGATFCLDRVLATTGQGDSPSQGLARAFFGLAALGCLWFMFRMLQKSRVADKQALEEHGSSRE